MSGLGLLREERNQANKEIEDSKQKEHRYTMGKGTEA